MSKYYYTPLTFAPTLTASAFNTPLSDLDTALGNLIGGNPDWSELTSDPAAPDLGMLLYFKDDHRLYFEDTSGTVTRYSGDLELITLGTCPDDGGVFLTDLTQTYNHLWLRAYHRGISAGTGVEEYADVRLNGVGASEYFSCTFINSAMTNLVADSSFKRVQSPRNGNTAGFYGVLDVMVFDYTSATRYKHITLQSSVACSASALESQFGGGIWTHTDPVTGISYGSQAGAPYELWGIR